VLESFPDLRPEIHADDGIHTVMGVLERAVMESLQAGNESRARAVVGLLDAMLNRADLDPEIPNAIAISFVEPEPLQASTLGRRFWKVELTRFRGHPGRGVYGCHGATEAAGVHQGVQG
jgi:hypothetical protein